MTCGLDGGIDEKFKKQSNYKSHCDRDKNWQKLADWKLDTFHPVRGESFYTEIGMGPGVYTVRGRVNMCSSLKGEGSYLLDTEKGPSK